MRKQETEKEENKQNRKMKSSEEELKRRGSMKQRREIEAEKRNKKSRRERKKEKRKPREPRGRTARSKRKGDGTEGGYHTKSEETKSTRNEETGDEVGAECVNASHGLIERREGR